MIGGATILHDGMGDRDVRIDPLPNNLPAYLPVFDINGLPYNLDSMEPGFQRAWASIAMARAREFNRHARELEAMLN